MDDSIISIPEDPIAAQLDTEISSLRDQITALKSQRKLQTTAILSSQTTQTILSRLRAPKPSKRHPAPSQPPTDANPLLTLTTTQQGHNRSNLYRACASITTFRIQDPDPNAVDNGRVLGVRIDVSNGGKFGKPYYLMLNKPFAGHEGLRVHRHTLPPYIPLQNLVSRFLPSPQRTTDGVVKGQKQSLERFVRGVRREIVGHHNRMAVIKGLRKEFRLDEDVGGRRKGKGREKVIVDISAADAEGRQVRIEWVDGRIGRVLVGNGGEVKKCVVIGEEGRDWEVERRVARGRMEGIGERLREGIY